MFKTLPREPKTFPYLTAQNLVLVDPAMLFAATKSFSDASFDAPYRLDGFVALSVERAITFFTLF